MTVTVTQTPPRLSPSWGPGPGLGGLGSPSRPDSEAVRVFGAFKFNHGNWYEAQILGGGQPVSVVPFFMGSDATVARKNMSILPYIPFLLALGAWTTTCGLSQGPGP